MTECVYDLCSYICHTPCCTRTHFDTFHNFCFDVHLIAAKIGNLFALFLCQQNVQEHVEHNGNKTSAETDWKRPKKSVYNFVSRGFEYNSVCFNVGELPDVCQKCFKQWKRQEIES